MYIYIYAYTYTCIRKHTLYHYISVNLLMTVLQYINLLYFAWADQRIQQFYNYHNVSRTVVG